MVSSSVPAACPQTDSLTHFCFFCLKVFLCSARNVEGEIARRVVSGRLLLRAHLWAVMIQSSHLTGRQGSVSLADRYSSFSPLKAYLRSAIIQSSPPAGHHSDVSLASHHLKAMSDRSSRKDHVWQITTQRVSLASHHSKVTPGQSKAESSLGDDYCKLISGWSSFQAYVWPVKSQDTFLIGHH